MPDGPSFGRSSGKRTSRASARSPAQSPPIDTLKVGELKARLQDARLSTQGNKAELRARLEAYREDLASPRRPRAATRGLAPTPSVDNMGRQEIEETLARRGLATTGTFRQKQTRLRAFYDDQGERQRRSFGADDSGGATGFEDAIEGFGASPQLGGVSPTPAPGRTQARAASLGATSGRNLSFSPSGSESFFSPGDTGLRADASPPGSAAAAARAAALDSSDEEQDRDDLPDAIRELIQQMRDDGTVQSRQLIKIRRNEKQFPLLAREVAAKRYKLEALIDPRRAMRLERYLEAQSTMDQRRGRDYDAKFSTRRAAPVDANRTAIIAAHTAPGPIDGLRVWQRPRFADIEFVQPEINVA